MTTATAPPGGDTTTPLDERVTGALVGAAVGDALGGPVEGYSPEQILERHGGRVHGIVGPWNGDAWRTARPLAPYHKGDGHVTDDTLMTHALVRVYDTVRDHLDAYAVAEHLVPDLMTRTRWIPELEAEALPLQRVFLAEKWLAARLHYGHVDPREAGTGNIVNCGAAMYMAPVGLVNAANPAAAYAEALDVAGAHQSSYGREAAGVLAAAVAAACAPGATPDSVVAAALALAKDGTRAAIEAVCEAAARCSDFESALGPLREAVAPYDTVGPDYRAPSLGARRPSRLHAIEELPVALGMLLVSGGDFRHAVLGAVNYGRDCDSIATMAGALAGALGSPVPEDWAKAVAEASRLDLWAPAATLTAVAREVFARDVRRRRAHEEAFAAIGGAGCSG
ncbi:ADP-ribosylglycohydrolase family protein [Streptomyces rochei]|uniref:ADP-ribosylglycohydrolase family protein n=4 Tax=Streptomyces TaxID=1883 RepID=A0ABW7DX86_STRRO|nr:MULTISPECIES: ADP-ribosylglycohydrolase family protein [Streptomyces]QCR51409.1 ADP-ribosylglycohydrolase family protein [Streptomyces sp. SGAir0924]RSR99146.1 ADP-ribosylglycohydrolase family protein [Streptomyces sp. WAC04189]RSS11762.1 ADP-ribosylglycohydrolase family protein [Streptomyces sp. WAC08401]RSS21245.1 ADP-ribosylglycohydrolase family protein [Streptomyces sp. WAC05458]RSS71004.1 ADP-ribosylglycohydrolase family protein [Streptomyces sp. WAC06273]RSS74404.1 ADP-ribosylglycohy